MMHCRLFCRFFAHFFGCFWGSFSVHLCVTQVTCTPPRSDGGLGGRNPNPRNAILEEGETLEPEPEPMPLP